MTSRKSKREVAPPPFQAGSAAPPWPPDAALSSALPSGGDAMAPPAGSQAAWWTGPPPQTSSFGTSAPPDCGMDLCLFLSYLQPGQHQLIPPHVSFPAPWQPTCNKSVPTPSTNPGTQHVAPRKKSKSVINVDDNDDVRTAKRLVWEQDEDLRLVSAWLYHSNDLVNGNGKKNDSYWGDGVEQYDSTTPANRKREIKHLKDRWQRIKRWVGFFCASWTKATPVYTSGQPDDQLRDKALQFYLDDYPKEGPFS